MLCKPRILDTRVRRCERAVFSRNCRLCKRPPTLRFCAYFKKGFKVNFNVVVGLFTSERDSIRLTWKGTSAWSLRLVFGVN